MINVKVDEAAAFDMLSILEIKSKKSNLSSEQYVTALNNLVYEIGSNKFNKVKESDLYIQLLNANRKVFEYVDILNEGTYFLSASTVHSANMERYRIKNKLQKEFFSSDLTEEKL